MRVIHTLCRHLLMLSVCLAGIKGRGSTEEGCVGGAGRKRWVGRVLLPSLEGQKRKSGLRGKAEREDVIEPNALLEETEEVIFISSINTVIMLSRSKIVTVNCDQTGLFMMKTVQFKYRLLEKILQQYTLLCMTFPFPSFQTLLSIVLLGGTTGNSGQEDLSLPASTLSVWGCGSFCAAAQDPVLRKALGFVICTTAVVLKFVIFLEQTTPNFHIAQGPLNYIAVM